jgi:hypothetical protein
MSSKISVVIRKNSHEVIGVITNHYKKCNGTTDEIPAFLCYWELLWQHFLPVVLKLPLYQLESNIPSPSCTPTRRSRTEILWARGALPHTSPYANTTHLCTSIQYSKINVSFHKILAQITESIRKHLPFGVV